jgi:flavorubredoxin
MKSLLIIYHSQSGSCASLARAADAGARLAGGVNVRTYRALDAGIAELETADALVLVAAENSGALNGGCKDFLDRVFYPAIDRGLMVPYALVISAGNDGRNAIAQAQRILSGIPFREVAQPLRLAGEVDESYLQECDALGQALATGLELGIY